MKGGKSRELFDGKFIELIKLARQLNENVRFRTDLYFHPQKGGNEIVIKTIDLCRTNPLCKYNNEPRGNKWEERWIEAYIINDTKNKSWKWVIDDKECRFLSSQFTFPKDDSSKPSHVDLTFFDDGTNSLVVLELKRNSESLNEAKGQLKGYIDKMTGLYGKEGEGFREAFELEAVEDIVGYIVYPRTENDSPIEEKDFPKYEPFGLMEYIKPWGNSFDEVIKSGKSMEIDFTRRKPVGRTIEVGH